MPNYTVTVATGTQWFAGTDDYIYMTLVGSERCSERTLLDKPLYNDFERGAVDSYDISVGEDLGEIELVKIEKKKYWMHDDWYCKYITVKTPYGDYIEFPCFRWLVDDKEVILRDGRARLAQHDKTGVAKQHRRKELEQRQKTYRWKEWHPGFPMSIDAKAHSELPRDIQFDSEKGVDFVLNYSKAIENLYVNQFMHMFQSSWGDFADFERIFVRIKNTISEYVMEHWKEDFMFGYQFLNGCNPVVIRKCTEIPDKFPVTQKIVQDSLERGLTLEEELNEGNIFIADYELLDGVTPNATDPCTLQYLAAPICLLYKNSQNKIMPIAIQLGQRPGEDTPIFLPSDDEYDWLLAKIWVRSSDFHVHQTVTHLLRTHLISEVYGIAMFRQLPAVHPVFKLLLPHIRFTIAINTKAREQLICECGLFDKANGTGGGGHVELVQKSMKTFTYRSLCFPEAIKARGMESREELPYYFYRDDGCSVWEAVTSFVTDVVDIYYDKDETVQEDEEIQAFVKDVCSFGMQDFDKCEFPKSLQTKEQLVEYLTIVIFTASAQHAAVNFGQYDWCSWIPNSPPTMRKPPPTKKGEVDLKYIVESLPDRGRSCWHLGAVWALSQFQENELFLGMYPDEHFIEKPVKEAMVNFRKNLAEVAKVIKCRNEGKKLPYYYFSPDRIPNSVAV
ncbi:arachidonate 5-lipoxygenase-like isoform X1 [Sinocyclocheilus anshuiensis]|uniref:Arachidonate 5-lipoxygenase-like n=2 Tax=Sinocyclocheilus anshuiensis TaxID=1608454 RepID=A0A671NK25_9TELE|nr:PREDICTED: arachidonate 5-lipoxygenase-like isoform X1 [Sinocyclocheilus anshuiensis]